MLKRWKSCKKFVTFYHTLGILSQFGREARSIEMNSLSLSVSPMSILNIHPASSLPFKMTWHFLCTEQVICMDDYSSQTFCLSKLYIPQHRDLVQTTAETLLQSQEPLWPDSPLCETLQMGPHTSSCTNEWQYHQNRKWKPLMWQRREKHH